MKRIVLPTRKRVALKRLLKAAAVLLVVNHVFLLGLLLPRQAVHQTEERQGIGRTRVVTRDWAPEVHKTHLIYLTENERATMLSGAYLTVYGWMDAFGWALDCTTGAPFYAGEYSVRRDGAERSSWYYYGRVDDPAIERIVISMQVEDWENGEPVRREVRRLTANRADWLEKEGRRYFLFSLPEMEWNEDGPVKSVAIAFDGAGREMSRLEIDQGSHSWFG